ncbi:hypothetical protein BLW95_04155 [Lacticaseibacillus paracasei]|nr:hypothetical protein BLW95_04155 [Lacticaseibacillus paracasei]
MFKKKIFNVLNDYSFLFKIFDVFYVLINKFGKVVVKYVGGKYKGLKICVWVFKVFVFNVKGFKIIWVFKVKN